MGALAAITANAIDPALAMLPAKMNTAEARVMLLAIGLQESRFEHRYQVLNNGRKGPARGLWQFERGGGVVGVLLHSATRTKALEVCEARGVPHVSYEVWIALEYDDVLAAAFARLLLYTDPQPLPKVEDCDGAWALYANRVWKPGKPHPGTWTGYHEQAREFVCMPA